MVGPLILRDRCRSVSRRAGERPAGDLWWGVNTTLILERIGEDGIRRLVAAFYRRIRQDDLLGPMYPQDDWEGSEARLAGFLIFRIGGSDAYIQARGHPRLRMRHAPFAIDQSARDRWVALMDASFDEVGLDPDAAMELRAFLQQTATFMQNR